MAIENVTAIITDAASSAVESNPYVWIFLVLGGIIGTFLAIMLPYYREKRKFGKEGIDLFFDKDFLKVGAGALMISVVVIGAIYPQLLANNDPSASYGSAFIAAATLAFTLNVGGSWIIGTNNKQAEEALVQKKAELLLASGKFNTSNNGAQSVLSESEKNRGGNTSGGNTVGGSDGVINPNA